MRTRIIAEIGANHNGDMALAEAMIAAAAEAGADYVKFQSWQAKNLKPGDPNYARHKRTELSDEDHHRLMEACSKSGVKFLTTCFDMGRVDFLASLGLETIKVASPDCGSLPLIAALRERFPHLIISTGMTPTDEVIKTGELLKGTNFTFLHCTSLYPTPEDRVNLARMDWLRRFTPSVGYSDHTLGTTAAMLAIARGADFVEKHFTLSRCLPGKDQRVSCQPDELRDICAFAKSVERMMGSPDPGLTAEERQLRSIYVGKWGNNRAETAEEKQVKARPVNPV